jgi:uncharacterized protein (TIGR00159 family)
MSTLLEVAGSFFLPTEKMTEFLQNLYRFSALLDISLAAIVIYRVSLLLKGAFAVRILTVMAALLSGHLLCRIINLPTIRLIIDSIIASSLLIVIIIFQSDVRRAITLSRNFPGRKREKDEVPALIDELVVAVVGLAQKRIGALIVIERSTSVDSLLVVGTDIDARVTSELISSIFLPYSPIHDGAVIIQKGKLTKAGCFLPLTQNPDVGKSIGTRHRAAMGLTELVDAVVVVVSEETGAISIVVGGRQTQALGTEVLRKTLQRLVEPRWLT